MTFADVHDIGRNSGWNLQHCVPKFPRGEWIDIDLETSRHMDNRTVSGAIVSVVTDVLENPKEPSRVLEILIPSGRCPHHHHNAILFAVLMAWSLRTVFIGCGSGAHAALKRMGA